MADPEAPAALLATAEQGRVLREGVRTAIVGRPNAGKSSLLNLLLGCERAIVSDEAGTTRDAVYRTVEYGDHHFWLVDTAGLKDPEDEFEATIQDQIEEAAAAARAKSPALKKAISAFSGTGNCPRPA